MTVKGLKKGASTTTGCEPTINKIFSTFSYHYKNLGQTKILSSTKKKKNEMKMKWNVVLKQHGNILTFLNIKLTFTNANKNYGQYSLVHKTWHK